ncbi:SulP family inorganic anion transporter [Leifsonia sp. A12D58]|uniref:SulP family inorganic anion transporter n=1 Tax=Leifsonia sp. A12D58 TaxID=3397674 RepID=UPI0039E0238A
MVTRTTPRRLAWFFPTLAGYQRSWIRPDILAGISAGAVIIPQGMAYATIANLPVQVGLYTCMVPMLVYAMLGGSRAMSVSTTSTIATLTATTLVTGGIAASSDDPARAVTTLTLLVGLILVLARILKLGSLVENISRATIVGIQIGVGATVAIGQLPKMLGVDSNFSGHGFIRSVIALIEALPGINLATTALSVGSVLVLVFAKRMAPRLPAQLIVVIVGILLVAFAGITTAGVALIDPVPTGLPLPALPSLERITGLIPGALAISIMAFLETAAVARGIREAGDTQIDSNQELLASGAASLAGAFFQTLPAAGGFSQSAVNRAAGAKSQLATLVTVALAVLVALFLGRVLSLLPQATLAAMVFIAVVGLIDIGALVRYARISRPEFWIATVTAVMGLTVGLLAAVAVGVATTFALVLHELNRVRVVVGERRGSTLAIVIEGSVYTANVLENEQAVLALVDAEDGVSRVVLDLSHMMATSLMVIDALEDLDRELAERGITLVVAALPDAATAMASKTEWFSTLRADGRVFASVAEALR